MKTIREVFTKNLRIFRGNKTQAEIAELAGIPLRSYQRAEYGELPQEPNLAAIAKALGVPETHLFVDFDEFEKRPIPQEIENLLSQVDPLRWGDIRVALEAYLGHSNGQRGKTPKSKG